MDNLDLAKTEVTLPSGHVLADRYMVGKILGRGGMGIVYLATDQKLDMTVAIKVLNSWLAHDEKSVLNLKEEAKIGMRLVHPNIMRIYNFEDLPAAKFLIMEYIDGLTLSQMMLKSEGRKLPVDKAIAYARQICAGLQYAHAQKVLHRDVKPSNIIVDNEGIAKITDFGIACVARDSTSRISGSQTPGTLLYMSPEQFQGEKMDVRSDIYSLGATVYELLAGDPPFHTGSIEYQILNKVPRPIDGIPDRINEVLLKALAKNKEQRWASAEEFLEALEGKIEVESDRKKREAEEKRKLEEARRLAEEKRRVEAEKQRWETERQPWVEVNPRPLVVKLVSHVIKTLFAVKRTAEASRKPFLPRLPLLPVPNKWVFILGILIVVAIRDVWIEHLKQERGKETKTAVETPTASPIGTQETGSAPSAPQASDPTKAAIVRALISAERGGLWDFADLLAKDQKKDIERRIEKAAKKEVYLYLFTLDVKQDRRARETLTAQIFRERSFHKGEVLMLITRTGVSAKAADIPDAQLSLHLQESVRYFQKSYGDGVEFLIDRITKDLGAWHVPGTERFRVGPFKGLSRRATRPGVYAWYRVNERSQGRFNGLLEQRLQPASLVAAG